MNNDPDWCVCVCVYLGLAVRFKPLPSPSLSCPSKSEMTSSIEIRDDGVSQWACLPLSAFLLPVPPSTGLKSADKKPSEDSRESLQMEK